jgi:cytochrome b561
MNIQPSPALRHSRVVMLLHWLIAISVIVNWRLVEAGEHAPKAEREALMGNHFALGIVILLLAVLMIGWKLTHRSPPMASHLMSWEVALAKVTHTLFYILLIAMPVLGWVAMSSYGQGIDVFGLFIWPALPIAANPDLAGTIFDIVAGALKHQFIDRDGNLYRMLPFGNPKP